MQLLELITPINEQIKHFGNFLANNGSSTVVSIFALWVSWKSLAEKRRSYINLELVDTPNDRIAIKIKNSGNGIAQIKSLKFTYANNIEIKIKKDELLIDKLVLEDKFPIHDKKVWKRYESLTPINPNSEIYLFELEKNGSDVDLKMINSLRGFLKDSSIQIKYKHSVGIISYECEMNLQYFGRKYQDSADNPLPLK